MSLYPDQPVLKMLLAALPPPLFILDGHEVAMADPLEWGAWMAQHDCTVNKTDLETFQVVTTFLGYQLGSDPELGPLTFLTSILQSNKPTWPIELHATWGEANRRHQEIVNQVK